MLNLPKADVHIHFESLFDPELLYEVAGRNSIIPSLSKSEFLNKRQNFNCLNDLLDILGVVCEIPASSTDIYDLLMKFYEKISTRNIVYIEPQMNVNRYKFHPSEIIKGAVQAASEAESLYGIKTNFLLQFSRGAEIEAQKEILYSLEGYKTCFAGVGIAGNEFYKSSKHFKPLFDLARNLGFCRNANNTTVHSGEEAPPNYIIESLHSLGAKRLDHGIRAREDKHLLKFLGDSNFHIAMCPYSNDLIKVNERFCEGKWPYHEFIEAGCMVSINSDDPEAMNSYLDEVHASFIEYYRETKPEIVANYSEIVKNAFRMSFMEENEKHTWIKQIDAELAKIN